MSMPQDENRFDQPADEAIPTFHPNWGQQDPQSLPPTHLWTDLWIEQFLNHLSTDLSQQVLAASCVQELPDHLEATLWQQICQRLQTALGTAGVAIALPVSAKQALPLAEHHICYMATASEAQTWALPLPNTELILSIGTLLKSADRPHLQHLALAQPIGEATAPFAWLLVGSETHLEGLPAGVRLTPDQRGRLLSQTAVHCAIAIRQARQIQAIRIRSSQLTVKNRELAQMNQHKSEFLANTSHEIRTPLSSILGFTRLLQEQGYNPGNRRHQEYLSIILSSGRHLLALINDILDLSKIEANQLDLQWETVNVQELCQNVLLLVKEKANDKGLQLRLDLDPEVSTFVADPLRLKQMLFNLLSNGLKFTTKGTVGLRVKAVGVYLHFIVWDTGAGIPLEHQAKLFRPYVQVANDIVNRDEGTGLGLALTQKLAQLHGGRIELQSELNRGSEFTVVLPLTPSVQSCQPPTIQINPLTPNGGQPVQPVPSAQPSAIASSGLSAARSAALQTAEEVLASEDPQDVGGLRLLLVEDSATNAKLIITYLCRFGYEIGWAKNAEEMWRALEVSRPALILMDIQLPDEDGLSLIRQIRADQSYQAIPIIAQTAKAMSGDRDTCLKVGASAYLSKPIDLTSLGELVMQYSGGAPLNPKGEPLSPSVPSN